MVNLNNSITGTLLDNNEENLAGRQVVPGVAKKIKRSSNPKFLSNKQAAKQASKKGALPSTTLDAIKETEAANNLAATKDQMLKMTTKRNNTFEVIDALSQAPNEQIVSPEGMSNIQKFLPGTDPQKVAKLIINRKKAIEQLRQMPAGTKINPEQKQRLAQLGINQPGKYMDFWKGLAGGAQKVLLEQGVQAAKAGTFSPFAAAGQSEISRQKSAAEQAKLKAEASDVGFKRLSDNALFNTETGEIKTISGGNVSDLSTKEKLTIQRQLSNDFEGSVKAPKTVIQMAQNIADFSDPKQAKVTIRTDDGRVIKSGNKSMFDVNGNKIGSVTLNTQNIRDVGLLYSFIKIVDPESVVREGEIRLTDSALGALQKFGINIKKLGTGQILNDAQRQGIKKLAQDRVRSVAGQFKSAYSKADSAIQQGSLNKEAVLSKEDDRLFKLLEKEVKSSGSGGIKIKSIRRVR